MEEERYIPAGILIVGFLVRGALQFDIINKDEILAECTVPIANFYLFDFMYLGSVMMIATAWLIFPYLNFESVPDSAFTKAVKGLAFYIMSAALTDLIITICFSFKCTAQLPWGTIILFWICAILYTALGLFIACAYLMLSSMKPRRRGHIPRQRELSYCIKNYKECIQSVETPTGKALQEEFSSTVFYYQDHLSVLESLYAEYYLVWKLRRQDLNVARIASVLPVCGVCQEPSFPGEHVIYISECRTLSHWQCVGSGLHSGASCFKCGTNHKSSLISALSRHKSPVAISGLAGLVSPIPL